MTKLVAAKCRIELHDAEKRGYFHFDTAAPEAEHNAVLCTAVDKARRIRLTLCQNGIKSRKRRSHHPVKTFGFIRTRREITKIMPRFGFRKRGILGKEKIHERFYVL